MRTAKTGQGLIEYFVLVATVVAAVLFFGTGQFSTSVRNTVSNATPKLEAIADSWK